MRDRCYVSGKITGLDPVTARIHFDRAADIVAMAGYNPVNPMAAVPDVGQSWQEFMIADIKLLFECQAIYMLSNWQDSRGARIEHAIAREIGLKIHYEHINAPCAPCSVAAGA